MEKAAKNYRHPFNLIKIQLLGFSRDNHEGAKEVGSVAFHIHDVIRASPLAGSYDLWNENIHVGDLEIEITFSYGTCGYGYSYQIHEPDVKVTETVQYSLFPRLNPRYNECETGEAVKAFAPEPVPKVLEAYNPTDLGCSQDWEKPQHSGDAYQPDILMRTMTNIQPVYKKYYSMNDRAARLMFLSNYLSDAKHVRNCSML